MFVLQMHVCTEERFTPRASHGMMAASTRVVVRMEQMGATSVLPSMYLEDLSPSYSGDRNFISGSNLFYHNQYVLHNSQTVQQPMLELNK